MSKRRKRAVKADFIRLMGHVPAPYELRVWKKLWTYRGTLAVAPRVQALYDRVVADSARRLRKAKDRSTSMAGNRHGKGGTYSYTPPDLWQRRLHGRSL